MNFPRAALSVFLVSGLLGGCHISGWGHRIRGDGAYTETQRELTSFDRISLSGGMDLVVVVGEPQKLVVAADSNLHEYIRTRIDGSTLEIDFTESISTGNKLSAKISVPSLKGIEVSGSSQLNVTHIDSDEFYIDVAGSVSGTLAGTTRRLDVDIAGSGKLDLYGLQADDVKIDIAGNGNLQVNARERLDVDVAGNGNVTYRGHPNVSIDQAGSARVRADKQQDESM